VLAFPRLADAGRRRRAAAASLAAVGALGAIATLTVAALPHLTVNLIGGPDYAGLAAHVWVFAAIGSVFAMCQLLMYSRMATSDRRTPVVLGAAVVLLVTVVALWRHGSLVEVATTALAVAASVSAVGLLAEWREHRPTGGEPGDQDPAAAGHGPGL
jgi:O-antigen/teichoic acid export membrane protein